MGVLPRPSAPPIFFLLLFATAAIPESSPWAVLWTTPAILASALMIAWAAESAQFFIAQGFALAMLAWLQTLPEFAVEAVLAWHQEVHLLLANLTGALRLLTGLGWPVIYMTAAVMHRRRTSTPLRAIHLHAAQSVEVVGLIPPLAYSGIIVAKGSLTVYDAAILILIYAAYLTILSKLPPEDPETIDDLEKIPRAIVCSPRGRRIAIIGALFAAGGALIYYSAEPFLSSLLGLSTALGIPAFFFVQWVAPLVSEFPEMASTFYWARTVHRAPMALMNMVSSNINQWTLLAAMLPILLSLGAGSIKPLEFDPLQRLELLMTLAQAVLGLIFLLNMELAFWEAGTLFVLFAIPLVYPPSGKVITIVYFIWIAVELARMAAGRRRPLAITKFIGVWRKHVKAAR